MSAMAKITLNIVIVGAGIGGLTAATFLAQDGHKVTVFERQPENYQNRGTGGGICLFNNSKCLWKQRGLLDRILQIADSGYTTQNMSYKGDMIAEMKSPEPHSFVHRADLLRVLYELAVEHKVNFRFGTTIDNVSDDASRPYIKLVGGEQVEADLIIAADGINSFIRRQIYPSVKAQLTNSVVLLVDIPEKDMLKNEGTAELWRSEPFQHSLGPSRDIVFWSMRKHDPPVTHLQFCDHAYRGSKNWYAEDSPDGPLVSTVTDLSGMRERWIDFEPRVQQILDQTKSYVRWKIAEVPALSSFSSPNRGFVLLGDAAHAVMPFAGQGANMSVEDSACLATMLNLIETKAEIPRVLELYDSLRLPRLAGLREIIQINVETFGAADGSKAQKERNDILSRRGDNDQRPSDQNWRKYGAKEAWIWLIGYDTIAETNKAWTASVTTSDSVGKSMI